MTAYTLPQSAMPTRRLDTKVEAGFPKHWNGGDPFATHIYNSFSMSFPQGEQEFIDSVRACSKMLPADVQNDKMRADIKDFIAQEATHRYIHGRYNKVLLEQGYINHWEGWIDRMQERKKDLPDIAKLSITVVLEHMTAMLADLTFEKTYWLDRAHPELQTLWRWHAAEEGEHRAVAFDLYKAVGGGGVRGYLRRCFFFVLITITLVSHLHAQTFLSLKADGSIYKPSTWFYAARFWLHPTQGMVWGLMIPSLKFFSPWFHPWTHAGHGVAIAKQWLVDNQSRWTAITRAAPAAATATNATAAA